MVSRSVVGNSFRALAFFDGVWRRYGGVFSDKPPPPPPRRAVKTAPTKTADAGVEEEKQLFHENDFVESEQSRDPFRSFAKMFVSETTTSARSQRKVVLEDFGVDDLNLVGIVTGPGRNRAMFVAPGGKGTIVHRGQYIGKAEVVRGSGTNAPAYELNWRIDRIRSKDVVLIREDPAHSEIPPATRIIPLHPDKSKSL